MRDHPNCLNQTRLRQRLERRDVDEAAGAVDQRHSEVEDVVAQERARVVRHAARQARRRQTAMEEIEGQPRPGPLFRMGFRQR